MCLDYLKFISAFNDKINIQGYLQGHAHCNNLLLLFLHSPAHAKF